MNRFFFLFLFSSLYLLQPLMAQNNPRNTGTALLSHFNYAYEIPGGDLADLYGNNFRLGLGLEIITEKRNLIFGLDGGIMFGNRVKEDVLANLRTPEGGIIGNNKVYADVVQKERGFLVNGLVGKLFLLSKEEGRRSGIRATVGMGLLQHKVRIQDDFQSSVVQLDNDYKKGYDKLTNGLVLQEFIGYQMLSANGLINFYVGFEFTQGFTQNRRDWDFNERRKIDDSRLDLLTGIKVGWTLPFYIGEDADSIEYESDRW